MMVRLGAAVGVGMILSAHLWQCQLRNRKTKSKTGM